MPFLFSVIVPFIPSFGKGFGTKCPNLARTVSSKQQATDSCGEDSDRTRRGPLPRPPRNHPLRVLDFLWDATNCCGGFGGRMLDAAVSSLPPLGVVLRAANQDNNDCRWQSYLCFVPRSGKGGVVGSFGLSPFIEQHPLSLALLDSSPRRGAKRAAANSPGVS